MEETVRKIYNEINIQRENTITIERKFALLCEHCICPAILLGTFYNYSRETVEYSPLGPYCDPAIYNTLEGISDWYLGLFGLSDIKWAIEYLVYKEYITVSNVIIDKQQLMKIEADVDKIYEDSCALEIEPRIIHDPKYALLKAHKEAEDRKRRAEEKAARMAEGGMQEVPPKTKIDPIEEEKKRLHFQNKRARKVRLPATLTIEQWIETLNHFEWRCAYCKGRYAVLEHFIPIIHGGGTTWDNCVPACPRCNALKMSWNPLADWGPDLSSMKDGIERVQKYLATRKAEI